VLETVGTVSDKIKYEYQVTKAPFPVSNREFLLVTARLVDESGNHCILAFTPESGGPDKEVGKKNVRGYSHYKYYFFVLVFFI